MLTLGIAAESESEARLVASLGDRVIVATAEWTDGQLAVVREWRGADGAWLDVHRAHEEARARGVRLHGHFRDGPGEEDAHSMRNLLAVFADALDPHEGDTRSVVVVARDTDEDEERLRGFQQAVADRDWPFCVVSAHAHPEREAWLLVAFEPIDDAERVALSALRQELGFDPTARPEELKSGDEAAKRNAKRVLACLLTHHEATARFAEAPLDRLAARGVTCGLTRFLTEFRVAVAPALGAPPA